VRGGSGGEVAVGLMRAAFWIGESGSEIQQWACPTLELSRVNHFSGWDLSGRLQASGHPYPGGLEQGCW